MGDVIPSVNISDNISGFSVAASVLNIAMAILTTFLEGAAPMSAHISIIALDDRNAAVWFAQFKDRVHRMNDSS